MKYLIFFLLSFFQLYCSAQNEYIIVGSGGGFSGETVQYKLLRDGTVLKGNGIVEIKFNKISHIRKKEAKKLFKKTTNVASESFNHPGNMRYFVYIIKPGSEIKCIWGDEKFVIPKDLDTTYQELFQKLSRLEYKPLEK